MIGINLASKRAHATEVARISARPPATACAAIALALLALVRRSGRSGGLSQGQAASINQGKKAEAIKDYDTAVSPLRARAQSRSQNVEYELKVDTHAFRGRAGSRGDRAKRFATRAICRWRWPSSRRPAMIDPGQPHRPAGNASHAGRHCAKNAAAKAPAAAPPRRRAQDDGRAAGTEAAVARSHQFEDDQRFAR